MLRSPAPRARLLVAALLLAACGEEGSGRGEPGPDGGPGEADSGWERVEYPPWVPSPPPPPRQIDRTYAPTFTAVYWEILEPSCALDFCHNSDGSGVNFVTREIAHASLIDQPSTTFYCGKLDYLRVVPGEPEQSLLYLKVRPDPPCGDRMPACYGCQEILPDPVIDQIRQWIALGAPLD